MRSGWRALRCSPARSFGSPRGRRAGPERCPRRRLDRREDGALGLNVALGGERDLAAQHRLDRRQRTRPAALLHGDGAVGLLQRERLGALRRSLARPAARIAGPAPCETACAREVCRSLRRRGRISFCRRSWGFSGGVFRVCVAGGGETTECGRALRRGDDVAGLAVNSILLL